MADKLEVGMYLRHEGLEGEFPIIQKIIELKTPGRCGAKYNVYTDKCGDWFIDSDYIEINKSKCSFNIMDLIQDGDVYYYKAHDEFDYGTEDYEDLAIFHEEDRHYVEDLLKNNRLIRILTRESFESVAYRIEE